MVKKLLVKQLKKSLNLKKRRKITFPLFTNFTIVYFFNFYKKRESKVFSSRKVGVPYSQESRIKKANFSKCAKKRGIFS